MTEFVKLELDEATDGAVATIRIDKAPVNALNSQVQDELHQIAEECARQEGIRSVILWGGQKVFVAGADVKEFHRMSPQQMQRHAGALSAALDAVARLPKPVIAAVTGYALGGGCELALTADFRVSADNAQWGQPEILLGVIPGAGGTQRLPRLIGPAKAKDLIYTGRFVGAQEAAEIGLVDVVVAADEVYPTAYAMAAKFARGPALALRAAKAVIDGGLDTDLANGLRLESHVFASLFATEDKQRGMASFIENGPGKAEFVGN
jgi:enoyl-CoA hydratase/carnithine racemase